MRFADDSTVERLSDLRWKIPLVFFALFGIAAFVSVVPLLLTRQWESALISLLIALVSAPAILIGYRWTREHAHPKQSSDSDERKP